MNNKTKNFIMNLTKEIGGIQLKYFSKGNLRVSAKTRYFNDIVTKVDKLVEDTLFIRTNRFGFRGKILTEERGEVKLGEANQRIIIDPLDGTFFYSRGIPNFCVAIALEENNNIVFATVYNPFINELFSAEKGGGAFLNNKKIKVSETNYLDRSTIILSAFPNYEIEYLGKIFLRLMESGGLRLLTHLLNLNLCYIGAGRYDGCIAFYNKLPEWDKLPGIFILEESGGIVTDFKGKKWQNNSNNLVATNGKLHSRLLGIVS